MAHSRKLPLLRKDCIPYIEGCGWEFSHYNRPWYTFTGINGRKTANGSTQVHFTLTELRHAYENGW